MKNNLLVTTAVLALMISAGANAQTRNDMKPDQPAASQSQKERGSATQETNRSDADRGKSATTTTTGQSKAADDTKSDNRKPASAQDSTAQPRSNAAQSTGKTNDTASDRSNDKSNDKTNAARQDHKSASDRSKQANEPRDIKSNTAGQNDSKQPAAAQRDTGSDRNQANTNSRKDDRDRNAAADSRSESATRISASLKTEQKTRLQQAVTKLDVKPVTNVDFSISVGTAVPRTVSLHPVPSTIVEIVPQYRGYDYFVVREQVIIVHPETHKIVDVIERRGSSRAGVSTTREKRVTLSDKQRSYIRQHATSRRTTTTTGAAPRGSTTIVVGEAVPSSVEIESFPTEVYREVPTVREYRYIRSGTSVYLVDPGTRRVIEEID